MEPQPRCRPARRSGCAPRVPPIAVLEATSKATVPHGNVYLYDGNTERGQRRPAPDPGQDGHLDNHRLRPPPSFCPRLARRQEDDRRSRGRIAGAGRHPRGLRRWRGAGADFIIPAGTPAGTKSKHLPAHPGRNEVYRHRDQQRQHRWHGRGGDPWRAGGDHPVRREPTTVEVKDIYCHVGSLLVRKTIAGPAAGQQGEITIHSECNGKALTPDFVIPAGTPAGDQTKQYDDIHVPAKCKVTETVDGHTSTVSVVRRRERADRTRPSR